MDLTGISGSTQSTSTGTAKNTLGKDDFLKLLMTQLGHQDPLSPMDSQAFVAQLAQFASIEQAQAQSQRLDALVVAQASANQLHAASLVGKEAVFRSGTIEYSGKDVELNAELSGKASAVTVTIRNASGATVRTVQLGAHEAGALKWTWNGQGDSGPVPDGTYTVSVTAADATGQNVPAESMTRGRITGVSFEAGYAQLILSDGARVSLADISQITEAERTTP